METLSSITIVVLWVVICFLLFLAIKLMVFMKRSASLAKDHVDTAAKITQANMDLFDHDKLKKMVELQVQSETVISKDQIRQLNSQLEVNQEAMGQMAYEFRLITAFLYIHTKVALLEHKCGWANSIISDLGSHASKENRETYRIAWGIIKGYLSIIDARLFADYNKLKKQ